jgi:hypothetical protein
MLVCGSEYRAAAAGVSAYVTLDANPTLAGWLAVSQSTN